MGFLVSLLETSAESVSILGILGAVLIFINNVLINHSPGIVGIFRIDINVVSGSDQFGEIKRIVIAFNIQVLVR